MSENYNGPTLRDLIKAEKVDHPAHYGGDTVYEHIKVVEAWGLNYALGSATKYICRAGKKLNELEDLKKALWWIQHEIARVESEQKQPVISGANFEKAIVEYCTTTKPVDEILKDLEPPKVMRKEKNQGQLLRELPDPPPVTKSHFMCGFANCIALKAPDSDFCSAHVQLQTLRKL